MDNQFKRVDVHAHYITEQYRTALLAAGFEKPDGMPAIPLWNVKDTLEMMDRKQIQSAMLSISSPGVHFGDDSEARKLARIVNDEGSQIVKQYPGRFGLFATLPLPDIEGALEELDYAMNDLKADGIVLETNYHGVYLGDKMLERIFEKINSYGGVIFIHPTSPFCNCCTDTSLGYPRPMLEFIFETTRAVINLILTGVTKRFSKVRIIVPHGGAALPMVADRVAGLVPILGLRNPLTNDELFQELKGLYYDLAGTPLPRLLPALLSFADEQHILYGSDYPFTPEDLVGELIDQLEKSDLTDRQLLKFMQDNALALFPRFRLNK